MHSFQKNIVSFSLGLVVGIAMSALPSSLSAAGANEGQPVTIPIVSTHTSPVTNLEINENSFAAVRKPLGKGPFPAVIFLHGGLGRNSMSNLRAGATTQPTQCRFLAWGLCDRQRDSSQDHS